MKSDEQIIAELARAADGIWYMSESDYLLETVHLDGTEEPGDERLRELVAAPAHAIVEKREIEEFFRDGAAVRMTKGGAGEPASFGGIVQTLKENLENIQVYRIGEINISVYVLGKSVSGNWLGLCTRVVET